MVDPCDVCGRQFNTDEEHDNHLDENRECPDKLKALNISAEKNKALYNFDFPDPKVLEKFKTPKGKAKLNLHIVISEFSSLCPISGQPDWATIIINYVPDEYCVESKSLKLYKEGFRGFGEFHEACVQRMCSDLVDLLDPFFIEVIGQFAARGGIPFHPTAEYYKHHNEGELCVDFIGKGATKSNV